MMRESEGRERGGGEGARGRVRGGGGGEGKEGGRGERHIENIPYVSLSGMDSHQTHLLGDCSA